MTTKIKMLAAATVAAVTIAGTYAFAQGGHGMGQGMMKHGKMGGMDHAGDPAARLAALKTEIGIRPEQATAWDAYAKIVSDVSAERRAVRDTIDRDVVHKMEPKDRQTFRESMQGQRDEARGKMRTAAETLLGQLDDAQKDKARQSLPGLIAAGQGEGMRHGMRGDHAKGQGYGFDMGQGHGPGMGRSMERQNKQ